MNSTLISTLLVLIFLSVSCRSQNDNQATKHIIYLHGKIVEDQGVEAFSERFGKYELDSIVARLKVPNSTVHCEVRATDVDPARYAEGVSKRIDSLIGIGTDPINITVVGASKGAIIASFVSSQNNHPINYVLLAGNNEYQERTHDWKFHGQILAIYELSDEIAGKNYNFWKARKNYATRFEQIEINTGLGHGFLYKPIDEWLQPAKKWVLGQKL
jgi:hypothetical protein